MKREFQYADSAYDYIAWIPEPRTCPHCGRSEAPKICLDYPFTDSNQDEGSSTVLIELFQCTYADCQKYFIKAYKYYSSSSSGIQFHEIAYSYSGNHLEVSLPEGISEVSPTFVEIYKQAVEAENQGLDQLSGIGYRKALEFLIKDYAIRTQPDNEAKIRAAFLGKVISDGLSDFPKLQSLAKAANWIGTDQTHYEQRYSDNDIDSMKRFIRSAATFIAADFQADEAQQFIVANDPKKQASSDK